jgi:predicted GNAT family acetyltransferase
MTEAIIHRPQEHRFTCEVDGHACVLHYHLNGQTMTITHTGVPEAVGGRGLAGALTRFALDHARQEGWSIVPMCSYSALYIDRHPSYQDLVVGS